MNTKYISGAIQAMVLSLLMSSAVRSHATANDGQVSSFIVWCDCDTSTKKARLEQQVRRIGGSVIYSYRQFSALAVAARGPKDAARLKRDLKRMPGVVSVQDNEVMQLQSNSVQER